MKEKENLSEGVMWDKLRDKLHNLAIIGKSIGYGTKKIPNLYRLKKSGDEGGYKKGLEDLKSYVTGLWDKHPEYEWNNKLKDMMKKIKELDDLTYEKFAEDPSKFSKHQQDVLMRGMKVTDKGVERDLDRYKLEGEKKDEKVLLQDDGGSNVTCRSCHNTFDYLSVPEAGMGYVKCPNCGEPVTQGDISIEEVEQSNQRVTKYDMKNPRDREEFNKNKTKLKSSDQISTDDDGNVITREDFSRMISDYGKINLSESDIISILEETQNPIMSKSELMESITNNLLNEADMDDSVRRSFESGNNDYSEHMDPDTVNRIANQAFEEIRQEIQRKTGRRNVDLDDVQGLLGQSLMAAAQQEYNYGIERLEQMAVNMIRKQFNIPEDSVDFDVEITGLPPMMLVGRPDIPEQMKQQIQNQIGAKVGSINKGNIQYEKGNRRPPQGKNEQELKGKVTRRRYTNAMMQGAARKSQNLHHLNDEIRQENPRLGQDYANIMAANNASYWMMSDETIKNQARQGIHAGNVRVELSREEGGKPKIIAQGIVFPILLHELAKGVVELMSMWSLPEDPEVRAYVLDKTDNLEAETNDIRLGPTLWGKFVAEIPVDNQEVISLTWHKMQEISDDEFNNVINGLLNDQEQSRSFVRELANDAMEELSKEEYEDALPPEGDYDEPEENETSTDDEGDYSDPELNRIMGGGGQVIDDEDDYDNWDTSDLRRAFDEALDNGDMELVRKIGSILSKR